MAFKMKNQSMAKMVKAAGDSRVAMKMKAESAMKLKEKSPMEKELVGKQGNLPPELKAKIEAAPSKMKSAMKKNGDNDAKIKALQDKLAKAVKDGNDREINAIRRQIKDMYESEKRGKGKEEYIPEKSPAKMKEKSAMKADKTISFKKVLKKGYSKNAEGNVIYRGKPVPSYRLDEAYEVRSSKGGVVGNSTKKLKMDKEYKLIDKDTKGGDEVPSATKMKRKTQVDGEQVTASKASGGMFMKDKEIKKDLKGGRAMLAAKKNAGRPKRVGTSIYSDTYQGTGDTKSTRKAEKKFAKADKKLAKGKLKAAARKVKKGRKTVVSMPSGPTTRSITQREKRS